MPSLLDQLMQLPPLVRMVTGAVMLGLGGVGICLSLSFYSAVLLGLAVLLGVPLLWIGWLDRARQQIERAEMVRAGAELPNLRAMVAAAVAARRSVGSLLRHQGFTSEKVRRWIALECDVVLPHGADRPW